MCGSEPRQHGVRYVISMSRQLHCLTDHAMDHADSVDLESYIISATLLYRIPNSTQQEPRNGIRTSLELG